jgi:oligopeptidase A
MHPFLAEDLQVAWSTLVPEAVEADIRHALSVARENLSLICSVKPAEATYENTFGALESAGTLLEHGWGRLYHLDSVCDEPAQRAALNAMLPEVSDYYSSIPLNDRLWKVLKAYGESPEVEKLDATRRRFVQETMLDFVQSGADLPAEKKQRISEIDAELSKLTKQYSENVLDSTNAWELIVTDEAELVGLPASAKSAAQANAEAKGHGTPEAPAWRFTLQFPSMFPVMQHAESDALRRKVWEASMEVGFSGKYDNTGLIWEVLKLRQEKAEILGHANFADLVLQRSMARDGATALKFVEDLHARVEAPFHEEYKSLCAYKAEKLGQAQDDLEPWEFAYWSEKRRKEEYDFDDELLRPYFPVDRVMEGMFELCSKLFGISIQEKQAAYYERGQRPGNAPSAVAEVWHPEVKFYDLRDAKSGAHLGSFYADWHPRESKSGGAWMNCLHTGHPGDATTPRDPHLGLVIGNMTPPVGDQPALLTHREVETIFHEFGHLLHGLLSDVTVRALAGTNVPRDYVELPSQIMENFCWDRASLDLFARHYQTGETIPDALYQKMVSARNFMSATAFMRQLAFGKFDLELHINLPKYLGRDLDELDREVLAAYRTPLKTNSPAMMRRFTHIFGSPTGYAAAYYSYKWSEVLDADAFTRFQQAGVISPEVGREYRSTILSKGNSEPVDQQYRNFMGRDPELSPLLQRAGLA